MRCAVVAWLPLLFGEKEAFPKEVSTVMNVQIPADFRSAVGEAEGIFRSEDEIVADGIRRVIFGRHQMALKHPRRV